MDKFPRIDPLLDGTPQERMAFIVDMMREMSRINDPELLVKAYGSRMRQIMPVDASISLSRRALQFPQYRITRSSQWGRAVNPWKEPQLLPTFSSGLLGALIYGDKPVIIDDLEISPDDPAAEYFAGMQSLAAIPLFEQGEGINMVVLLRKVRAGFSAEMFPVNVWMGNLFGRATRTLVLANEVKAASDLMERELNAVANIQRSLLPARLPAIEGLELAVYYQTSRLSGGDYYDFFKLPDDQWGILIADVSGHGTPAAVLMAITHSIAHVVCDPPAPPQRLLGAINTRLVESYTHSSGSFVTAFYGVYDPRRRTLVWSNAGHPSPRLRHADGTVGSLPPAESLPLGIEWDELFGQRQTQLAPGDLLLFYTDGITETRDASGDMFDPERLDDVLGGDGASASSAISATLAAIEAFSEGNPPADDRTLLAARVK